LGSILRQPFGFFQSWMFAHLLLFRSHSSSLHYQTVFYCIYSRTTASSPTFGFFQSNEQSLRSAIFKWVATISSLCNLQMSCHQPSVSFNRECLLIFFCLDLISAVFTAKLFSIVFIQEQRHLHQPSQSLRSADFLCFSSFSSLNTAVGRLQVYLEGIHYHNVSCFRDETWCGFRVATNSVLNNEHCFSMLIEASELIFLSDY